MLYALGVDVTDIPLARLQARAAGERMMHVSRLVTMSEMASGIAHELNQPLAAITTYAQAAARMLKTSPAELHDVAEALEQISAQGMRAGAIIRCIRKLVSNYDAQREPTQINELVEITFTPTDAHLNGVRIMLDLVADLPLTHIDRIQIQQVLLNLVRNAVQALGSSSSAGRQVVISTAHGANDSIEVRVSDNGPGVSRDMLGKLFTPFATTKAGSAGMGLAISRSIVEAHNGKLEYKLNSPQGACFAFRIPALKQTSV